MKDLLNSNASVLLDNGYNKPICNITLCDKQRIIQTVALNQVIISSLAELSQLRSGLSVLGVGDLMKKYPTVLAPFFCLVEKENLTAGIIIIYLEFLFLYLYSCILFVILYICIIYL